PRSATSRPLRRLLLHCVQLPLVGEPLERVGAARCEPHRRAGEDLLDRVRNKDLARTRYRGNARGDVYRDAGDVVAAQLDLAEVDARPCVEVEIGGRVSCGCRALHRCEWTIE